MTSTLIFDKDIKHVLMCNNNDQKMLNYIGGKIRDVEQPLDASYRNVEEVTGLTRNDIDLLFVREEHVARSNDCWRLHVTTGVLDRHVILEEGNTLQWVALDVLGCIAGTTFGNGSCYTYLVEALDVLKKRGKLQ